MYYSERNEKAIQTLHPVVQNKVRNLIDACEAIGEDFLIYSAGRTVDEQNELYSRGRTKDGRRVTNAWGDGSFHVWDCAIDIVPVTMLALRWNDYDRFRRIAAEAMKLGFVWGLDAFGNRLGDYGHFHYSQGLTIEDFRAGKRLQYEQHIVTSYSGNVYKRAVTRAMKRFSGKVLGRLLLRLQKRYNNYNFPPI